MPSRRVLNAAFAAMLMAAPLLPVQARPSESEQQGPLSLSQAADLVRSQVGGKVLAAEAVRQDERTYYLIRMLVRKGQVKVFRVDPESGRIF